MLIFVQRSNIPHITPNCCRITDESHLWYTHNSLTRGLLYNSRREVLCMRTTAAEAADVISELTVRSVWLQSERWSTSIGAPCQWWKLCSPRDGCEERHYTFTAQCMNCSTLLRYDNSNDGWVQMLTSTLAILTTAAEFPDTRRSKASFTTQQDQISNSAIHRNLVLGRNIINCVEDPWIKQKLQSMIAIISSCITWVLRRPNDKICRSWSVRLLLLPPAAFMCMKPLSWREG